MAGGLLGGHQHEPTTSTPTWELPSSGARTRDPPSPSLTAWAPREEGLGEQTWPPPSPGKSPRCKREAYEGGATSTWPIEGVAEPVVVVPVEEGEADVGRAVSCFPKYQRGDVAPELEGGPDGQAHLVLRQVRRPVHHPVRQVPLVPLAACGTGRAQRHGRSWATRFDPPALALLCFPRPNPAPAQLHAQKRQPKDGLSGRQSKGTSENRGGKGKRMGRMLKLRGK